MSASPFTAGKHRRREEMLGSMALKHRLPIAYVNQFGGNDDLVFDGRSSVFGADGAVDRARPLVRRRRRGLRCRDGAADRAGRRSRRGIGDLARARRSARATTCASAASRSVVLGLSGGIDSALTAAIAVDALGADRVLGVLMPSPYSSRGSLDDAHALAANLGIETMTLPIEPLMHTFDGVLRGALGGDPPGVAAENIQARIRGNLLMALSNTRGALLLTTGNKSELSVGYCTLYGDMSGGLAVIADVPKTMVYRVARWRNQTAGRPQIPEATITKAPSAELRPNQTDQDSLPPYDVLDDILQRHVERHQPAEEIVAAGFDADDGRAGAAAGQARRIQAQAGGAGIEGHRPRVRHRLANADRRAAHVARPEPQHRTRDTRSGKAAARIEFDALSSALRRDNDSTLPVGGILVAVGRREHSRSRRRRPVHRRASGGASTATAPGDAARTSPARRCSAA